VLSWHLRTKEETVMAKGTYDAKEDRYTLVLTPLEFREVFDALAETDDRPINAVVQRVRDAMWSLP
jgi:hypothetical protein